MPCYAEVTILPPDVGGLCTEPGNYKCQNPLGCPNYGCEIHMTTCEECKRQLCTLCEDPEDHACHGPDNA